jgi:hypothetical protein
MDEHQVCATHHQSTNPRSKRVFQARPGISLLANCWCLPCIDLWLAQGQCCLNMGLCMVIPSALIRVSCFFVGAISHIIILLGLFRQARPRGLFPFGISGRHLPCALFIYTPAMFGRHSSSIRALTAAQAPDWRGLVPIVQYVLAPTLRYGALGIGSQVELIGERLRNGSLITHDLYQTPHFDEMKVWPPKQDAYSSSRPDWSPSSGH